MEVRVLASRRLKTVLVRSLQVVPATAPELADRLGLQTGVVRAALIELRDAGLVSATPKGEGGWQAQVWGA